MSPRARGNHVRKVCGCNWKQWPKCGNPPQNHPWYFSYQPKGGARVRFSFDAEFGDHIVSKIEAEKRAAEIRAQIDAGTFERVADRRAREQRAATERAERERAGLIGDRATTVTLDKFVKTYIDRAAKASGKTTWGNDEGMLARLCAFVAADDDRRLGEWPVGNLTVDTLETFFASLTPFAASTRNQYVQVLKAAFRWAAKKGYLQQALVFEDSALRRSKVAERRRRVSPDEEQRLIDAAGTLRHDAGVRLQWLIIAAIETGCRRGELLALLWGDVNLAKRTLLVRAVEEGARKTGRSRRLPISKRLGAILEMAKLDPAGREYKSDKYVFGALGERVENIKKAWETTILRANGYEPEWVGGALAPASRERLRTVNLHFHDLRHEAGCRWLERGWPIHHVQEMLGHANLSQTSTYLHASEMGLQDSMTRYDPATGGKTVANASEPSAKEQPPLSHEEAQPSDNSRLH